MNKLRVIVFIAVSVLLISANKPLAVENAGVYAISGNVKGLSGKAYLYAMEEMNNQYIVDSTESVGGKFSFNGHIDTPVRAYLEFSDFPDLYLFGGFFLDNSGTLITGDTTKIEAVYSSGLNKAYGEYFKGEREIMSGIIEGDITAFRQKTIEENLNNELGAFIYCFFESYYKSTEENDSILKRFTAGLRESSVYLRQVEDKNNKKRVVTVGKPYIDIRLPDANGDTVSLSSVLASNKYVLVDFWASWCSPCIDELPRLKELHNEFKDKGFSIYGVSLDTDYVKWRGAIEKHRLDWPNVSSLSKECPAKQAYGITAVPSGFLISSEGIIIKVDPEAAELYEIMNESSGSNK